MSPHSIHVLLVEDNPTDARLVRELLLQAGSAANGGAVRYELDHVERLGEALERLGDQAYSVVLLDLSLPDAQGIDTARQLIDAVPSTPVVVLSGMSDEEVASEAVKAGAQDYLVKGYLDSHWLGRAIQYASDRKLAEESLSQREKRFRALIENSSDAIALLDEQAIILYGSSATTRVLGDTPAEFLGENLRDRAHPDDLGILEMLLGGARAGDEPGPAALFRLMHKDGSWRFVEATAQNQLTEPAVEAVVLNYRDVTERVQREQEREAILSVASALRTAESRTEMLPILLAEVLKLVRAEAAAMAMQDPGTGESVIELAIGAWLSSMGMRIPPGEGLTGQVLQTREPVVIDDLESDPRSFRLNVSIETPAVACVPLIAQNQVIGAIWSGRQQSFTEEEVRLLSAIADMGANAVHRATLHEQTERRLHRLDALRRIDLAITSSLDMRVTLNVFLDQVTTQLGIDAAAVLLLNEATHMLEFSAGRGFRTNGITHSRIRLGEGLAGKAAMSQKSVHVSDLAGAGDEFARTQLLSGEAFVSYFCAPLIAKAQVLGVLDVYHRSRLTPDPEWLEFLETLAGQAAIAIDSSKLFIDLQAANTELSLAYDHTLEGWVRALDLRDNETEGHTQRVTEMTLQLALTAGITKDDLIHVRRGALLHDIGKMGISDAVLLKPGPLTEGEWVVMRRHPVTAYELLKPISYLRPALDIPYCHHEKWDGTGYPRGLKGEEIPLIARLFAIVDVWDALSSNRPYRPAWEPDRVWAYIEEQTGKHFDPEAVECFRRVLGRSPEGMSNPQTEPSPASAA